MKKNNKATNEKRNDFYYDMFWKLYNPDIMTIGGINWMNRIRERHYSWYNMRQLCIVMKWFIDNYYNKDNDYRLETYHTGQLANYITSSKKLHTRIIKGMQVSEICCWENNSSKQYIPKWQYKYVMNDGNIELYINDDAYNDIKIDQLKFKE